MRVSVIEVQGEVIVQVSLGYRRALIGESPNNLARIVHEATEGVRDAAANHIDKVRAAAPLTTRADSTMPSLLITPSCKGCGTAVEQDGRLCPNCEHKNHLQAPQATIALHSQGEPLYKREGNFRDAPAERQEEIPS